MKFNILTILILVISSFDQDNWKLFNGKEINLTFKYPNDWLISEEPDHIGIGNHDAWEIVWIIDIYDSSSYSKEDVVDGIGVQFEDRLEKYDKVEIDGIESDYYIILSKSNPEWYSEIIVTRRADKIYTVSNGGYKKNLFSRFSNSIKFQN